MKLQFKIQPYQTNAVECTVDCLAGQPNTSGIAYRLDPGRIAVAGRYVGADLSPEQTGFKNFDIQLTEAQLLANIQAVQQRQNLPRSEKLVSSAGCAVNLDVEMETGTGKTYCYIKTIFEMHKRFGWSKFIIMVPSVAIREGVLKSLAITAEHFLESYSKKVRFFAYQPVENRAVEPARAGDRKNATKGSKFFRRFSETAFSLNLFEKVHLDFFNTLLQFKTTPPY